MKNLCKRLVNSVFHIFGFEIHRITPGQKRMSMKGALLHIKRIGFYPATVIDVGAAFGDWTRHCQEIFPDAQYFLFEPLREYNSSLSKLVSGIKKARYFNFALGAENKNTVINVHQDLVGSSLFKEAEGEFSNAKPRDVQMVTLDEIISKYNPPEPFLLKIDVQGAELKVLLGAKETLQKTEYVILEVSFFQSIINAPQVFDMIKFMKEKGFVLYDIISLLYRPLDNALCQADMAFIKQNSFFRKDHRYCTSQQRKEQNKQFERKNKQQLSCKF